MGHLSRSLESGVSSFEVQDLHIRISFDDFLLSCVGFCKPMVSIIKDKIEFSSECFYFKRLVNQITLFLSHVSRRWTNQETLFPSHVSRRCMGKPGNIVT
jgi:hypothetical protein